jgi:pyruvate kinase
VRGGSSECGAKSSQHTPQEETARFLAEMRSAGGHVISFFFSHGYHSTIFDIFSFSQL